ncbi:unnamed protein product [Diabrotica balteata]|uniref:Moesin/ezrin/radixin homolog 1 n=1 Tax=Diabrotica balteata TaxID=107213 RepID=A0A9N9SSZ6_DIABA|nr:unnamed protein product [Diabrotica balteata]
MLKFGSKHDSNIVYKCTVRLLEDTEILECEYKHWLDLGKSICKQVKDLDPVLFSFRVKFYPPDPFRLKEEITRYQIFLQLKRDLLHGRLYCGPTEAAMLSALILQGEFGDYDPEIHLGNYVSDLKILLKQTEAIEDKAMEIHQKQLKGQSQSQVETAFLKLACQLDTYGVDPHPVKKKHTVGFKCPSGQACRHVWRCAVEQMLFFTLPTSSDAPSVVTGGGFFSWGTKFKYTGRTEKEILEDSGSPSREEPNIQRSSSVRRKASSVPATPSTPLQPHLGYCSLPRSSHSDVGGSRMESSNSTGLLSGLDNNPSQIYSDVAALETVTEDQEAIGATKLRTTVLKDDSMDRFSDYYFRDSFEHSSSESQLVDNYRGYETTNPSHRSSRSPTPLSHSHVDSGRIYLPSAAQSIPPPVKKPKKFNILGAFIPSLVIVLVLALISTIIVLESDWEFFNSVRNVPEIMSLKYQVYEPIKQYWRSKISLLF